MPALYNCLKCGQPTHVAPICTKCEIEMKMEQFKIPPAGSSYTLQGFDPVNHPSHYKTGGIETISFIRAKLTKDEFIGYCMGNVLKYTTRYKHKNGVEDLNKAKVYLQWAVERMSEE